MKGDCTATTDIFTESYNKAHELLGLITVLQQALGSSKKEIFIDGCKKLRVLQSEMERTDLALKKRIQNGPPLSVKESGLVAQKLQLQKEILDLNRRVIPKINNIKSALVAEMVAIKKGRSAVKGYGDKGRGAGRVINKSW